MGTGLNRVVEGIYRETFIGRVGPIAGKSKAHQYDRPPKFPPERTDHRD